MNKKLLIVLRTHFRCAKKLCRKEIVSPHITRKSQKPKQQGLLHAVQLYTRFRGCFHRSSRRHLLWKIRKTLPKTSIVELRLSCSYRGWTHSMFSCDFSRSCFSEHLLSTISLFLFTYFLFWNLNWIMLSFSAFELGLVIILYVAVSNLVHHNFVYYITPV